MTIYELQDDLVEELASVFRNITGKRPDGTVKAPTGYAQSLPIVQDDEEDEDSRFPYFIVRMTEGEGGQDQSAVRETATTHILLGVYENNPDNQGHRTILNMIQRFRERFEKNPLLKDKYRMRPEIKWALQDEDTYPYYFGGIEVTWEIKQYQKEDRYS